MEQLLLAVVEQGGYPNFIPDYQQLGFRTQVVTSVRKACSLIKKEKPVVVVAEFNHTSEFRDRVSNLESLLAKIQSDVPEAKVIVFYETAHAHYLQAVKQRFTINCALPFPVDKARLLQFLQLAQNG